MRWGNSVSVYLAIEVLNKSNYLTPGRYFFKFPKCYEANESKKTNYRTSDNFNRFCCFALRLKCEERNGSAVECLTRDRGFSGSILTGGTALCP